MANQERSESTFRKAVYTSVHKVKHFGVLVDIQRSDHRHPYYSYSVMFYREVTNDKGDTAEKVVKFRAVRLDRDTFKVEEPMGGIIAQAIEQAEAWIEKAKAKDAHASS